MEFECVWCHRTIEVAHAGWPYIHSVALLHFHVCLARPASVQVETMKAAAACVADALEKERRGISSAT